MPRCQPEWNVYGLQSVECGTLGTKIQVNDEDELFYVIDKQ